MLGLGARVFTMSVYDVRAHSTYLQNSLLTQDSLKNS